VVAAAIASFAQTLSASTIVRHMNLEQMCLAAGRIFRGTVIGVTDGNVSIGGGELPTVTYRIQVEEAFKGTFEESKGEQVATLRMIGTRKALQIGPVRRLPMFDDLPRFERGQEYLFLATTPSRSGLSITVGVGQGAFRIDGKPGAEIATSATNNTGLFRGMSSPPAGGPLPYSVLRAQILRILGR
jgi:hypothetical protein